MTARPHLAEESWVSFSWNSGEQPMTSALAIAHTLTIYDMRAEHPKVVSQTILNVSKGDALKALYAARSGLPVWYCASLVDSRGYNVRPS